MTADPPLLGTSGGPAVIRHQLAERAFDAIATGIGDGTSVRALFATERSQRRVLLRAVLDAARPRPDAHGPLVAVDEVWDLLVRAERSDPAETARVLYQPQTGIWATHVLRRIRNLVYDDAPLWADVGYLHAMAAAAAIRCGLRFRLCVPLRQGAAMLPTLGYARLPVRDAWETVEVAVTARGAVRCTSRSGTTVDIRRPLDLDTDDSAGWTPCTVLHARAGRGALSVVLDDIDPYRHILRPSRPARLTPAALRRWENTLADAWSLLVTEHPEQARGLSTGLSVLVPLARAERFRPRSASSGDAFGSLLLSEPDDAVQLAATLVHELQHAKLGALMHLFDLYENDSRNLFYAPWRDDPRPLGGLLQGVYAFFGVTRFWRRQRQVAAGSRSVLAHFEFALWRQQVAHTLRGLLAAPELTGLGRRFLDGVAIVLAGWLTEPVPGNVAQRAAAAAMNHRAGWRIRHLCPPADAVEALARAWAAKVAVSGPVPPSDMRPDPAARLLDTRSALTRLWLADRDAFRELQRCDGVGRRVSGATAADLAYVSADYPSARQLYLSDLADSPDRPDAWVGLGLTAQAVGHKLVAQAVLTRPELVLAVSRAVAARTGRRPHPWDLADWLGGCLRGQGADAL